MTENLSVSIASIVATGLLAPLSFLEHQQSIAPSILIGVFLWTSVIQSVAEATQIIDWSHGVYGLRSLDFVWLVSKFLQFTLAVIEELPKRGIISKRAYPIPTESTAGLLSWLSFSWLNRLLLKGYHGELTLNSLGAIDYALIRENFCVNYSSKNNRLRDCRFSLRFGLHSRFHCYGPWYHVYSSRSLAFLSRY
ncbi:hypothetical protein VHEMI03230 [[Torrubiella] hemipterigena]|uniref:Uncharacterized protein n=1 Tax=[Torrubiella] hemipterigena TaxID=1531966 RepID=A0A0A1TAM0_9HYPO|nr:hypothetical protein VHEMI03230 [[Torrubiella] hemipterigena]